VGVTTFGAATLANQSQVVDYLVRNRSLSKLALHAKETRENVSPI